jgi:hypothetical protein
MKKIVLVGTAHPIQRGEDSPELFKSTLLEQCTAHQIKGIAEEIEKEALTVAAKIALSLELRHLYADPDWQERAERGIQSDCRHELIQMYAGRYPGIRAWPKEGNEQTLPPEVLVEYRKRTERADRMREEIWLEKLVRFNVWPLLFICGADHFKSFANLLESSCFNLIKSHPDWPTATRMAEGKRRQT